MRRGLLYLAAFSAGFTITGIEIALGRLLAPFFGSGLAVWAAIIASVITALSVGYPLGGELADRRPGFAVPLGGLTVGGVLGALFGVGAPAVLRSWTTGIGMAGPDFWLRLTTTLVAFAIPCIALACVSPAVIRATLRERETAGRDAGRIYALGSLGSVLGILLPALWWVPELGLRTTFLILGAVALAPVVLAAIAGQGRALAAAVLALPLAAALPDGSRPAEHGRTVLFDGESPIQHVRVVAADTPLYKRRWLHLAEGWAIHSSYLEPDPATGDVWDWMALAALRPQPDDGHLDVLIVGLAAGTVSNLISGPLAAHLDDPRIDGVELDPLVVSVARDYLELDTSRLTVHVGDGRTFLRGADKRYDLIILDAYAQPTIPAHLASVEFFAEVRDKLDDDGLAVLNVFAPAERSALLDGLVATWTAAFGDSATTEGPAEAGFRSRLLQGGPALAHAWRTAPIEGGLARSQAWAQRHTAPTVVYARLTPWSDDRAPVERLTDLAFRTLRD